MKKFFATILAVMIMTNCFLCCSEAEDFNSYTDEEIIKAYGVIMEELVRRELPVAIDLAEGEYIVGVDIPAGLYIASPEKDPYTYILFDSVDTYDAYMKVKKEFDFVPSPERILRGHESKIHLREGMVLLVIYYSMSIKPFR